MSKNIVITIARQYGSGGKTIGKMLAKSLGISYYSRDIIRLASDASGISLELFAKYDERLKKRFFTKISDGVYKGELFPPESSDFVSEPNIFNYQAQIIKDIADTKSCVIIGRCADYILKDRDNVVSVFVHADDKFCFEKAKEVNGLPDNEVRELIKKTDRYRGRYYEHYTGNKWNDLRNYDLSLNSGRLGFEDSVEAIISYLKVRFKDIDLSNLE